VYGLRPENAIARVASSFKECLSETEVLRTIDDFFGDLGFEFDAEAEELSLAQNVGQRRSRAAGYLEALDLAEPGDRDRLLSAIAAKLAEWSEGRGPSENRLRRLHQTLKAAGFEWNGGDVVPRLSTSGQAPTRRAPARATRKAAPVLPVSPEPLPDAPSAFISYAHEDKELARTLADALRTRGCRIWIDVEKMRAGDDLVERIAEAIDSVDFLLAIVSEESVTSGWCKRELAIAFDAALKTDRVRVLPVRLGPVALPAILKGLYSPRVDPADIEAMADRLMADMESHRADQDEGKATARRPTPSPSDPMDTLPSAPAKPPKVDAGEPIRILGIDEARVTRPRNDGTAGSGLYKVPLRLNRTPSTRWVRLFTPMWDHPPQFTTMHRPGIASVSGDRIILDGTTLEEVERYHAATLRLVIPSVNAQVAAEEEAERAKRERADAEDRAHDEAVRKAAKRISFD
jgi:hypothetical protein